jgi:hypothetical protein
MAALVFASFPMDCAMADSILLSDPGIESPLASMGSDCCTDDGRFGAIIVEAGVAPVSYQELDRMAGGEIAGSSTLDVAELLFQDKRRPVRFKRKKHPEEPVPLPIPEPSTVEMLVLGVGAVGLLARLGRRRRQR